MSSTKTSKKAQPQVGRSKYGQAKAKPGLGQSLISQGRTGKSLFGGTNRTVVSSASRRTIALGGEKGKLEGRPPVQVYDEEGQDVTPLPLLQTDSTMLRQNKGNILADSSVGTPTDLMSQASIYQTGTVTASTFGGPFTRSVFSASQSNQTAMSDDLETHDGAEATAEITRVIREEPKEELTPEDLEKNVTLTLTETDTIFLLDLTGVAVSTESEEAPAVKENNEKYLALKKARVGNDRYMDRSMNTFNNPLKLKLVQTMKVNSQDVGINASNWDMHDTYSDLAKQLKKRGSQDSGDTENEEVVVSSRPTSAVKDAEKTDQPKDIKAEQNIGPLESQNTMMSVASENQVMVKEEGLKAAPDETEVDQAKELLESEEFYHIAITMERSVNLNNYQPKQALYRGLEIVEDVDAIKHEDDESMAPKKVSRTQVSDMGPSLDRLWGYACYLTKSRNVSCIAWNKDNPDLLAVGYGQFEYTKQKGGLVCCWSIKNPEFPERVFTTESGVTAVDFSNSHSNLLGVGLHNGTIAVYNVRTTSNEPILDSLFNSDASGKHTGPVWKLNWIEKERGSGDEKSEVLVSISTDGRITQWSIRKGFESYDLMKLKRVATKTIQGKVKKTEALISKHAGGLCFDFHVKDSNIYLAGTEEGHIHKCSCSYNEQYLDSYHGHTGPVYNIRWSPFASDIFLSCSGDWTIRLWHQDRNQPVLTFHSSTKAVPDVCWSPRCATVFACVNEGAVEVWDLAQSVLDPVIVNHPLDEGIKLSSVAFAPNAECLLVGGSDGAVSVLELKSMPVHLDNQVEKLMKIVTASIASQLK